MIIFCLFALAGCASSEARQTAEPELIEAAGFAGTLPDIAAVSRGPVSQIYVRHGIVRMESMPLSFETDGRLLEIHVFPGDTVYEGQLLARLDVEEIEENIAQLEEQLAGLIRAAEIAEEIFSLQIALKWLDFTEETPFEVERAEMLHAQSAEMRELDIESLGRRISELRAGLAHTNLYAPVSGTITYTRLWVERVSAGERVIYMNYSPDVFVEDVEGIVPARLRDAVRHEARVNGLVFEIEEIPMTTHEIAQATLHDMPLRNRFAIMPLDGVLPPHGAYASIVYYEILVEDTLRVPANAVVSTRDLGNFVYLVAGEQNVRTPVHVGAITDAYVEILAGIEYGDLVVVQPYTTVRPAQVFETR